MDNIAKMINHVPVPVIIKEVGFGFSKETFKALKDIGVTYVDVSGGEALTLSQ